MRLYYLTQLKTLEDFILPDQRIRISTFDKVNDPFELLGAIRGGKAAHHDFAWLRKHWTETQGFISFSENWASPLMWAHYAMNHTGACLGVEVPDHKPMKMDYQPRRIALDFDFKKFENAADLDLLRRIAATKFDEWKYEHEWRLLLPLEHDARQPRPEHFFESFTPDFELREVILGVRCERQLSEIAEQIFGVTAPVHVKRARPAFDSFSMVQQKLQHSISVDPIRDFTRKELRRAAEDRRQLSRQNGETRK